MALKRITGEERLYEENVIPIASLSRLQEEKAELLEQVEKLQMELNQTKQENRILHILNAQQQKDMEGMQKKYARIEQENKTLKEENTFLLSAVNTLKTENQQLRRTIFGQSTEKTDTAGHEQLNTTALPEGTACGTDEDTKEADMAEGREVEGKTSGNPAEKGDSSAKSCDSESKEKILRPNNLRRQMEKNLPTVHQYPLSPELIRRLDEMYGKEQWRILDWEGTAHLVHIPEVYVNQIDYVPVICLKDGTPVRPFTEHPEEFSTSILPHSVLSPSEFANIIHRKIALGIPLYRQEQDMLQMCGIHLGRQDMAKWMIRAGTQGFLQVYEYLIRQEQACEYHNIDETFLQVILDGRAASTKSYLWAHRTGELANPKHPIVVFIYEPTRAAEHLRKYFPGDIAAIISCDHYIAYETMEKERENVLIALCWMHVRRRFFYAFDLIANIKGLAEEAIRESLEAKLLMKIGELYREEMKLKNLTPEERKIGRDQKVRPLVREFFDLLHEMNLDDPAHSNTLKEAVRYALDGEEKLKRFLDDPSIPIDNGSAERIIRKVATGRRAWLFCDTPDGAKALSLFYSLVVTAQLNNANDYYYVKYLCEHLPGGLLGSVRQLSDEELEALMPWSDEYRAYEKNEIEARYDTIVFGTDMKRPTKNDILDMRRQMEASGTAPGTDDSEDFVQQANPRVDDSASDKQPVFDSSPNPCPFGQKAPSVPSKSRSDENELVEMPHSQICPCQQEDETRWRGQSGEHIADPPPDLQDEAVMSRIG
jgi:hypothetical protein